MPSTYSYADHLDAYPELATRENAEALVRLRAKGWRQRKHIGKVCLLASKLKVPAEKRWSQHQLVNFLDSLVWTLWSQVVINEHNIAKGYELQGSKVKTIGRDRRLYLENGRNVGAMDLDPRYKGLHDELRAPTQPTQM